MTLAELRKEYGRPITYSTNDESMEVSPDYISWLESRLLAMGEDEKKLRESAENLAGATYQLIEYCKRQYPDFSIPDDIFAPIEAETVEISLRSPQEVRHV